MNNKIKSHQGNVNRGQSIKPPRVSSRFLKRVWQEGKGTNHTVLDPRYSEVHSVKDIPNSRSVELGLFDIKIEEPKPQQAKVLSWRTCRCTECSTRRALANKTATLDQIENFEEFIFAGEPRLDEMFFG